MLWLHSLREPMHAKFSLLSGKEIDFQALPTVMVTANLQIQLLNVTYHYKETCQGSLMHQSKLTSQLKSLIKKWTKKIEEAGEEDKLMEIPR
jgi:hypothetical protein